MTLSAAPHSAMAQRLAGVRTRIASACERARRDPSEVTLVAISKTFPAAAVAEAWEAGFRDFGENRVKEGLAKAAHLTEMGVRPTWHLVGHLQRNKVRDALGCFAILHAIDSERLLLAIQEMARQPIAVCLEVNVAGEPTKFGAAPGQLSQLVGIARTLPNIRLEGLMTVAPQAADPELVRPVFRRLRELGAEHGLEKLSMGMSDDFDVAIEEGATHIRVGRAIFGERT